MATVAIGDVHGNSRALEDLLRTVAPELGRDDTLVFLGDYIDRGPDACGCVELITRLKEKASFKIVTLLGNHEDWMLRTMEDYTRHSWLTGMEAFDTIASYSSEAASRLRQEIGELGLRLVTERIRLPYELFFNMLPPTHLAFFRGLKLYHRTVDVVCSHGGVDPAGRKIEEQEWETLIWGGPGFPESYQGADLLVYGHWRNAVVADDGWPRPRVLGNRTFGLDTITHGVLTAMRFPDLAVFQSGRYPVL
jgi:serine/threonine protein phosphatase 1